MFLAEEVVHRGKKSSDALLLVEDNRGDARLLREMLSEQDSHQTELAHVESIGEAVKYLAEHAVDIILLDLGLPDAQGLEAVRRIRAAAPLIPLVVLTGMDDESLAAHAMQEGAQDYLIKGEISARGLLRAMRYASERKRSEGRLQEYEKALESLDEMIVVVDRDYRYVIANRAYLNYRGLTSEQLIGQLVSTFLDKDIFHEVVKKRMDECFQGEIVKYEIRNKYSEMGERDIFAAYFPVEGSAGINRIVCVLQDITARKEAEKHLIQMESRYRGLLEAAPDAMVVVNQGGEIVLFNVQAEKQFGYSRDELLGQSVKSIITRGFAERLVADALRSTADALAQQIGMGIELTGKRKDGSDFPIEIMLSPLENTDGILVTAAIRNITERKRAEAERLHLMTAIEQAAEGVVVTDEQGGIEYVNPAFSAITGYTREEALGQNPRILKSGKQDAAFYANMWATINGGQVWRGEIINRRKDESLYTEKMSITPVHNEQGELTHFVAMKEDITARKLLEDQFRQAQKMEAVGRLAAGVAHDFNNLLTIINGYSELMIEQFVADDPRRTYTAEIKSAGERAAGLTRQLLAFSRQQVLAPQVLDLNTLMANLTKLLMRLIDEDIELILKVGQLPSMIKADPGQIEQVLMNLVVNARDAMPLGGKLTLETSNVQMTEAYGTAHYSTPAGSYALLTVSDTGCGMDKDTQAHIFEPFFTTKEQGKGTGLGLATVYGIVQQSGAYIWVYSEPGVGTTFKIYFPMVSGGAEAAEEVSLMVGGTETVLLVEDDAGLRGLARMVLEGQGGYNVLESAGGNEAKLIAGQHQGPIHLLLTDVVMPGMGGRELSEELAILRPEMKILFMSGYTDDTVVRHGVLEEGMAFLQKPFTAESLLRKVRDTLDSRSQGQKASFAADSGTV